MGAAWYTGGKRCTAGYCPAGCRPSPINKLLGTGTKFVIGGDDSAPAGSAFTRKACSEKIAAGGCDSASGVKAGLSLGTDAIGSAGIVGCEAVAGSEQFDSCGKWADGPTISQTIGYRAVLNPIENAITATAPKAGSIFGIALVPVRCMDNFSRRNHTPRQA
jgi:hypothetical protein